MQWNLIPESHASIHYSGEDTQNYSFVHALLQHNVPKGVHAYYLTLPAKDSTPVQ
jgi:hypothetical protein